MGGEGGVSARAGNGGRVSTRAGGRDRVSARAGNGGRLSACTGAGTNAGAQVPATSAATAVARAQVRQPLTDSDSPIPPPTRERKTAPAPGPSAYEQVTTRKRTRQRRGRCLGYATDANELAHSFTAAACEIQAGESRLALAVDADKVGDGPVVGALRFRREKAARQLAHAPMVADTLTALALSRAGLVGAGALGQIVVYSALHILHP